LIPENELLFICTRKNFQSEHQKAVFELCDKFKIKWDIVHLTALQHQIAPLIYSNLLKCENSGLGIVPEVLARFRSDTLALNLGKLKQQQDIVKVLSHFNRKSVDVMLIKGAALSFTVYQDFSGYVVGDIDLILKNCREEVSEQEDQEDIVFFEKLNAFVEWERFQHHDVNRNETLPIDFKRIWSQAKETTFQGQKVLVMSPEDMLLATCINSCRKRFFRLKSLCDIAEIMNYFKELDWEVFIHNAKKYHCRYIVYTSLLVTSMTVGCDLPKGVLSKLEVGWFRSKLIYLVIKYLYNRVSLNFLLPSGIIILGKNINPTLILNFIACNWLQFFSKRRVGRATAKPTIPLNC
jgi:hypothetical protein